MLGLPKILDTTAWDVWMSNVFSDSVTPTWPELLQWDALYSAQHVIVDTNLTIRYQLIAHALGGSDAYRVWARVAFDNLRRDGFWLENFSYWRDVIVAHEWYVRKMGTTVFDPTIIEATEEAYAALVAPNGELWLPETRAGVMYNVTVDGMADLVNNDAYYVRRWFNADRTEVTSYLLIAKDTNPEPRLNLHYHLAAGYVAFFSDGKKQMACPPYTGFDPAKEWDDGGLSNLLPTGALPPTWRVEAPSVVWDKMPSAFFFHWAFKFYNCSRKIEIQERNSGQPGKLLITDKSFDGNEKVYEFLIT